MIFVTSGEYFTLPDCQGFNRALFVSTPDRAVIKNGISTQFGHYNRHSAIPSLSHAFIEDDQSSTDGSTVQAFDMTNFVGYFIQIDETAVVLLKLLQSLRNSEMESRMSKSPYYNTR
ncbi:hypothetical protein D3C80_588870 [compost metagenome]